MHRDVWLCHAVGKQEARYGGCCSKQLSVFSNYQKKAPLHRNELFTQMLLIFFCNCLRYENIVSAAWVLCLLNLNSDA